MLISRPIAIEDKCFKHAYNVVRLSCQTDRRRAFLYHKNRDGQCWSAPGASYMALTLALLINPNNVYLFGLKIFLLIRPQQLSNEKILQEQLGRTTNVLTILPANNDFTFRLSFFE